MEFAINILVNYLYGQKNEVYKTTLWECFGEELYNNLILNLKIKRIDENIKHCERCGCEIEVTNNKIKYCQLCSIIVNREKQKDKLKKS